MGCFNSKPSRYSVDEKSNESVSEDFSPTPEVTPQASTTGARENGGESPPKSKRRFSLTNRKGSKKHVPEPKPGLPSAADFGLEDTHVVLDLLGNGGEGSAWLMQEKRTGRLCAVKLIKRPVPRVLIPFLSGEISIQAQLGKQHENIIDLEGIILTPSFLAIVLEYAEGGPLTRYICKRMKGPQRLRKALFLTENEALYFFKQFIYAVEFCHSHNFAHRDLKLDNTLLTADDPPELKISDFGFAKGSAEDNTFTTIGTPCYMSPEVLTTRTTKKGYNPKKADMWACGVLLFAMLYGTFPFDSTDHDPNSITTVHDILEQQLTSLASKSAEMLNLPGVDPSLISPECHDLLRRIFTLDPNRRITIAEVKEHAWYKQALEPPFDASLARIELEQRGRDERFGK